MMAAVTLAALSGARSAAAEDTSGEGALPACDGVRLYAAPDLAPDWADAASDLRAHLSAAGASCAAVTLRVDPIPSGARLSAMAQDGRYAERTVSRPAALTATALGLLTSIPPERVQKPLAVEPLRANRAAQDEAPNPRPGAVPPTTGRAGIWLGVGGGLRFGGLVGLPILDFEGRADLLLSSWMLTLAVRYGFSVGPDLDDFQYEETAVAVSAGHRFRAGRGLLDLTAGPVLALMNLQWNQDEPDPHSASAAAVRLGAAARWSSPIAGAWRFTITADAEVAPSIVDHPIDFGSGALPLPAWTFGIRLGNCAEVL
jgi:hypothetical protein